MRMFGNKGRLAVAALGIALLAAGCSSTTTSAPPSASHTYTVGVLTDLTGLAASGNKTCPQGVQAGAVLAKKDGYTIKYDVGDTQTSPSEALTAAQKLVEEDHVLAVIACSSLTFSASSWLTSQGVPVVGVAEDGPEWTTSKNMFSVFGPLDLSDVATTMGQFFKMEGATNIGSVGYSVSPQSAESAEGAAASAQAVGLTVGYLNANFPFGSTNVQPVALQMKSDGVNGVTASLDPNTEFALISALRQDGVTLKVPLLATGYGGDLLGSGSATEQIAKGVYFLSPFEPIEMHTAATEQFASALKQVGIDQDPTYAEYAGYTSVALLVQGLEAAGSNPTQAGLIAALAGIKDFTAAGLLGSHSLNMSTRTGLVTGVDNCYWSAQWTGTKFVLVPGADPLCGSIVAGKTVSAPS